MKTEEMPERIYLEPMHDHQFESPYEWVWVEHPVEDVAVEYVRADALEAQAEEIERLREALADIAEHTPAVIESYYNPDVECGICDAVIDIAIDALAAPSTTEETEGQQEHPSP